MMPERQLTVPPGFRFHPTDEELLHYYLRKKVSYEAIDLDVIREVDLNKLEPWDLKEKCRIGSGHQDEWYFFSHKDKKYPTGTRTNRATTAGFWKATGRDKPIHMMSNSKRIGMRKTLVFYTGRAPHGQKTDWIMHEYRLDDHNHELHIEDGWVVCRVFKKKLGHYNRSSAPGFQPDVLKQHLDSTTSAAVPKNMQEAAYSFDHGSMHLPQLFSSEESLSFSTPIMNNVELELDSCPPQNMHIWRAQLPSGPVLQHHHRFNSDWSFLNKLLASHTHHHALGLHDQHN